MQLERVDTSLVLGVAALGGGLLLLHPWPVVVALSAAMWLLRARLGRGVVVAALLLVLIGAWRTHRRLAYVSEVRSAALDALSPPRRCAVQFEVTRSPVVLTPRLGQHAIAGRRARVDGVLLDGRCGVDIAALPPRLSARLYGAPESSSTRGAVVSAMVDIGPARRFDNPGSRHPLVAGALTSVAVTGAFLDGEVTGEASGWRAWIDRARAHVRARIERTFLPVVRPHARALAARRIRSRARGARGLSFQRSRPPPRRFGHPSHPRGVGGWALAQSAARAGWPARPAHGCRSHRRGGERGFELALR